MAIRLDTDARGTAPVVSRVFQGIKAAGITSLSALPETWLGLLLQQAERDADVTLIQVAVRAGRRAGEELDGPASGVREV